MVDKKNAQNFHFFFKYSIQMPKEMDVLSAVPCIILKEFGMPRGYLHKDERKEINASQHV